jgi:hypothetical protein
MRAKLFFASIAFAASLAPLAASAAGTDSIRACIDTFVAQNLPGRHASFTVDDERTTQVPLIASTGTRTVALVASEKNSGRVIATAICKVRNEGGKSGSVTIGSVDSN